MNAPPVPLCGCQSPKSDLARTTATCSCAKRTLALARRLYDSIHQEDLAAVTQVLDDGANPDMGLTAAVSYAIPLTDAAHKGNIDIVKLLLQRGAQLKICHNIRSRYGTPVLWHPICVAADTGKGDIIRLMLDHGIPNKEILRLPSPCAKYVLGTGWSCPSQYSAPITTRCQVT
jgi:hypothetical protein